MRTPMEDIRVYGINAILKILLALIIYPVFKYGLIKIFQIEQFSSEQRSSIGVLLGEEGEQKALGIGLYEGILGLTSAYLTTIITENIDFGSFYPVF
jgi:hypothetical protein